jgi:hypothetical protein
LSLRYNVIYHLTTALYLPLLRRYQRVIRFTDRGSTRSPGQRLICIWLHAGFEYLRAFFFEAAGYIDFQGLLWYAYNIPKREYQGSKETLALGEGLALVIPKGDFMMPMKKPIRLMGVVFQIDK